MNILSNRTSQKTYSGETKSAYALTLQRLVHFAKTGDIGDKKTSYVKEVAWISPSRYQDKNKQGSTEGRITAGHCVGYGDFTLSSSDDDVDQPTSSDPEIGKGTELIYEAGCDCAFIDKNSSDNYQGKKVWYSSNYYTTITTFTDRAADNTLVLMTGSTSGTKAGIVNNNQATTYENGIGFDVIELTTDISADGDSGGSYTNLAKTTFYGTHKGDHSSSGNSVFIPWENIEDELGL